MALVTVTHDPEYNFQPPKPKRSDDEVIYNADDQFFVMHVHNTNTRVFVYDKTEAKKLRDALNDFLTD